MSYDYVLFYITTPSCKNVLLHLHQTIHSYITFHGGSAGTKHKVSRRNCERWFGTFWWSMGAQMKSQMFAKDGRYWISSDAHCDAGVILNPVCGLYVAVDELSWGCTHLLPDSIWDGCMWQLMNCREVVLTCYLIQFGTVAAVELPWDHTH